MFFRGTYLEYKKTYNYKKETYKEQTYNIALLSKYLNKGDKVYLQAISPGYYFLCKYDSPNYSKLGYKFPNELSLEMIHKRLTPNSYIIADTELRTNTYFKDYILHAKVSLKQKDVVILKKNF